MPECKCSLRIKLVGDGCPACNPDYWNAHYSEHVRDGYRDTLSDEMADSTVIIYDLMCDWHEIAEYFTQE